MKSVISEESRFLRKVRARLLLKAGRSSVTAGEREETLRIALATDSDLIPLEGTPSRPNLRVRGFSLLEMITVVAIILILAAISVPAIRRAISTARVRGAAVEYANLVQIARARAINDDRFYSVYVQPGAANTPLTAYVDIEPKVLNGVSGLGPPPTGHYNAGPPADPLTLLPAEVPPQPMAAAPNVAGLNAAFCLTCTLDLILNAAPTWGPDGMPCQSLPSGTGTVCNSSGGAVAYVAYFQSTISTQWSAVTVSPAGRVKAWIYVAGPGQWAPQ